MARKNLTRTIPDYEVSFNTLRFGENDEPVTESGNITIPAMGNKKTEKDFKRIIREELNLPADVIIQIKSIDTNKNEYQLSIEDYKKFAELSSTHSELYSGTVVEITSLITALLANKEELAEEEIEECLEDFSAFIDSFKIKWELVPKEN